MPKNCKGIRFPQRNAQYFEMKKEEDEELSRLLVSKWKLDDSGTTKDCTRIKRNILFSSEKINFGRYQGQENRPVIVSPPPNRFCDGIEVIRRSRMTFRENETEQLPIPAVATNIGVRPSLLMPEKNEKEREIPIPAATNVAIRPSKIMSRKNEKDQNPIPEPSIVEIRPYTDINSKISRLSRPVPVMVLHNLVYGLSKTGLRLNWKIGEKGNKCYGQLDLRFFNKSVYEAFGQSKKEVKNRIASFALEDLKTSNEVFQFQVERAATRFQSGSSNPVQPIYIVILEKNNYFRVKVIFGRKEFEATNASLTIAKLSAQKSFLQAMIQ